MSWKKLHLKQPLLLPRHVSAFVPLKLRQCPHLQLQCLSTLPWPLSPFFLFTTSHICQTRIVPLASVPTYTMRLPGGRTACCIGSVIMEGKQASAHRLFFFTLLSADKLPKSSPSVTVKPLLGSVFYL
jgi:hypothetical protein